MGERSPVIAMDITRNARAPVSSSSTEGDPYAPPRSRLAAEALPRRTSLDALLVGFLLSCGGTTLGGFLLRLTMLLDAVQQRFDHQHAERELCASFL